MIGCFSASELGTAKVMNEGHMILEIDDDIFKIKISQQINLKIKKL